MIVIENFRQVAAQIESERGVSAEELIAAIEQALVSACRRGYPEEADLYATLDVDSGEAKIFCNKEVVSSVEDDFLQIGKSEAKDIDPAAKVGDIVSIDITPEDFGRIAALTAKQVIVQRIREAEKNTIFNEFEAKVGTIIVGTVQRVENQNYLINLGRTEAILGYRDQIPGETFYPKDKIRVYVVDVDKSPRGPMIRISRTHPNMLKCLFEMEIPEIQEGIIDIMSVAREPGKRSKIAVRSNNPTIKAVGTCVGHLGGRIQSIIKELGQEKIDVLEWDENPKKFISNALKPAVISQVNITSEEDKTAVVVVPNDQLSLAIGKNGINVRLSVKLTGWKLDIFSEDEEGGKAAAKGAGLLDKMKAEMSLSEESSDDSSEDESPLSGLSSLKQKLEAARQQQESEAQLEAEAENTSETEDTAEAEDEPVRVAQLAKELKLKTADLMEQAKDFGVEIKSNRSTLTADQVKTIKENINS